MKAVEAKPPIAISKNSSIPIDMRSIKRAMNKLILNAVADCYLLCDLHCMIRKKALKIKTAIAAVRRYAVNLHCLMTHRSNVPHKIHRCKLNLRWKAQNCTFSVRTFRCIGSFMRHCPVQFGNASRIKTAVSIFTISVLNHWSSTFRKSDSVCFSSLHA